MRIKKRYDIEQVFDAPTEKVTGQLVSIDVIPTMHWFVHVDENGTDAKYVLRDIAYGIVIARGVGYNDTISNGIRNMDKVMQHLMQDARPFPEFMKYRGFPILNEFE